MSNLLDSSEEEVSLTSAQIQKVRSIINEADPYSSSHSLRGEGIRNLLILGRSGSGKTTIIDFLQCITTETKVVGLFAGTVEPKFSSFSIQHKESSYDINTIDTPGVNEVNKIGQISRSDEAILETVQFCLQKEVSSLHCLILTVSFGGKIEVADREAFKIYLAMFKNKNIRVALCITRCEAKTPEEEEAIHQDLLQDEYFRTVLKLPHVQIFYCGIVNSFILKNSSEAALTRAYKDIHRRREKLIKFIVDSDNPVLLKEFPIDTPRPIPSDSTKRPREGSHEAESSTKRAKIDKEEVPSEDKSVPRALKRPGGDLDSEASPQKIARMDPPKKKEELDQEETRKTRMDLAIEDLRSQPKEGLAQFFDKKCGVISTTTFKRCARTHKCPHHNAEARTQVRKLVLDD